jgi:hypothetical protein
VKPFAVGRDHRSHALNPELLTAQTDLKYEPALAG